jgi:hypothetical protein
MHNDHELSDITFVFPKEQKQIREHSIGLLSNLSGNVSKWDERMQ